MPSKLSVLAIAFGSLLFIAGVPLFAYSLYRLIGFVLKPPSGLLSGLGAGFALLFAVIGLALSVAGLLLIRLGARGLRR